MSEEPDTVQWVAESRCDHTETMCVDCRDEWERDHDVVMNDNAVIVTPRTAAIAAVERSPRPRLFTMAAWDRVHGTKTVRAAGYWGFCASRTCWANEDDLYGPIVWARGTLADAKREVAAEFPGGAIVAVLP